MKPTQYPEINAGAADICLALSCDPIYAGAFPVLRGKRRDDVTRRVLQ